MKRSSLKRRGFKRTEKRYGPLWDAVKRMPCFLRQLAPHLHPECGLGYAPATAHHVIPKGDDEEGLIPCCGQVHDVMESQKRREVVDFSKITGEECDINVRTLGLEYVQRAKADTGWKELEE